MMTYQQWRKLAVVSTDIRTMGIDGFDDLEGPVPGVAFMKPIWSDFRGGGRTGQRVITGYVNVGYITQDPKRGMWDVLIENTEKEFVNFEDAAQYLWDAHYKDELCITPYRLIVIDNDGEIVFNRQCISERHMLETAVNQLPEVDDPAYAKENCEADLSRVGARYHEFRGGHMAAFPFEDDE
jgi:hypothetical protein